MAFTAILFLSPQIWFPILGSLRIAFVAACLSIAAHLLDRIVRSNETRPSSPEFVVVFLLIAWATITVPVAYWAAGSVELLVDQYLKAIAFFWLIGTLVVTSDRLRVFCWTLVLCSIPLAATGITNYLSGEFLYTGVESVTRIAGYAGGSGIAWNPNDLALVLNLIVPIAAALMISSRGALPRIAAGLTMLLCVTGVIVTFSRAGFLTLAASLMMLFVVLVRRRSSGVATVLLVLALATPVFLPAQYTDRLTTITDIQSDQTGSAQGRWLDFVVAADVVMRNPVVGAGVGNDMLALNAARGFDTWRSVHNAYLQYAVDLGLPGLLLFCALHVMCFRSARAVERHAAVDPAVRHLGPLAAGVQVALVALFVAAMFHPIAYQFYFFTIAGLAIALKRAAIETRRGRPGALTGTRPPQGRVGRVPGQGTRPDPAVSAG